MTIKNADWREAVIIIGANALQNDLMAGFLEKVIAPVFRPGRRWPAASRAPGAQSTAAPLPGQGVFSLRRAVDGGR